MVRGRRAPHQASARGTAHGVKDAAGVDEPPEGGRHDLSGRDEQTMTEQPGLPDQFEELVTESGGG